MNLHQTLQAAAAQSQQAHRDLHVVDALAKRQGRCVCGVLVRRHFDRRNRFIGCEKARRHGR